MTSQVYTVWDPHAKADIDTVQAQADTSQTLSHDLAWHFVNADISRSGETTWALLRRTKFTPPGYGANDPNVYDGELSVLGPACAIVTSQLHPRVEGLGEEGSNIGRNLKK